MKNVVKLVLAIVVVALCSNSNASAQTLKLAHINMQELIVSMSEYDTAMVKMQKFTKTLEDELSSLNVERNKKIEEYTKNNANMTDLVRQSREQEITAMQQRIQMFQEQAQESYQQENEKLMQPVLEKANKAIEVVAKEQGITYVLSSQALLYKAVGSVDLLQAVKQHLGIKK